MKRFRLKAIKFKESPEVFSTTIEKNQKSQQANRISQKGVQFSFANLLFEVGRREDRSQLLRTP